MAINKKKNVIIQVTFPKEDAEHLETLKNAFENNGIKVSKSEILLTAFRDYLKALVLLSIDDTKDKAKNVKESQEDKKNA